VLSLTSFLSLYNKSIFFDSLYNLLDTLHLKTYTTANMKEALISTGPKVEIVDTPIPKAGRDQVVIKVVYSGSNPKDWKIPGALHSLAFQRGETD
jgi:hypothetical protein